MALLDGRADQGRHRIVLHDLALRRHRIFLLPAGERFCQPGLRALNGPRVSGERARFPAVNRLQRQPMPVGKVEPEGQHALRPSSNGASHGWITAQW
jgi:hypothetical protein